MALYGVPAAIGDEGLARPDSALHCVIDAYRARYLNARGAVAADARATAMTTASPVEAGAVDPAAGEQADGAAVAALDLDRRAAGAACHRVKEE